MGFLNHQQYPLPTNTFDDFSFPKVGYVGFQKGVCLHYPTISKYSDGYIYIYIDLHDPNVFLYMILSQRIYLPTFYHQHQSNVGKFVPYSDHIWD